MGSFDSMKLQSMKPDPSIGAAYSIYAASTMPQEALDFMRWIEGALMLEQTAVCSLLEHRQLNLMRDIRCQLEDMGWTGQVPRSAVECARHQSPTNSHDVSCDDLAINLSNVVLEETPILTEGDASAEPKTVLPSKPLSANCSDSREKPCPTSTVGLGTAQESDVVLEINPGPHEWDINSKSKTLLQSKSFFGTSRIYLQKFSTAASDDMLIAPKSDGEPEVAHMPNEGYVSVKPKTVTLPKPLSRDRSDSPKSSAGVFNVKPKTVTLPKPLSRDRSDSPKRSASVFTASKYIAPGSASVFTSKCISPDDITDAHIDQLAEKVKKNMISSTKSSLLDEGETEEAMTFDSRAQAFVTGFRFELVHGCLVILYSIIMALQLEYEGLNDAYELGSLPRSAAQTWPWAGEMFSMCEMLFGVVFTAEVLIKLVVLRKYFITSSYWNLSDLFIVMFWWIDRVLAHRITMLRLGRLWRLVRFLRLFRVFGLLQSFEALMLMTKSVKASFPFLLWTLMLWFLVVSIIGTFVCQALKGFIQDPANDTETRLLVFEKWGTFSRSMVTMVEITLANWGPSCRLLMDNVHEWWGLLFVLYKCFIGIAVVQIIQSVFTQQTIKAAEHDEKIMIATKRKEAHDYLKHVRSLFQTLDKNNDGSIKWNELQAAFQDEQIKHWFAALEVDMSEASELFEALDDDHDGAIQLNEFIDGMKYVRGHARGIHMIKLLRQANA